MRYEWLLLKDALWHEKGRLAFALVAIVLGITFFAILPGPDVLPDGG